MSSTQVTIHTGQIHFTTRNRTKIPGTQICSNTRTYITKGKRASTKSNRTSAKTRTSVKSTRTSVKTKKTSAKPRKTLAESGNRNQLKVLSKSQSSRTESSVSCRRRTSANPRRISAKTKRTSAKPRKTAESGNRNQRKLLNKSQSSRTESSVSCRRRTSANPRRISAKTKKSSAKPRKTLAESGNRNQLNALNTSQSSRTESSVSCRICLEFAEDLSQEKVPLIMTSCGHVFCLPCMTHWLKTRRRSCPICRCKLLNSSTRPIFTDWK